MAFSQGGLVYLVYLAYFLHIVHPLFLRKASTCTVKKHGRQEVARHLKNRMPNITSPPRSLGSSRFYTSFWLFFVFFWGVFGSNFVGAIAARLPGLVVSSVSPSSQGVAEDRGACRERLDQLFASQAEAHLTWLDRVKVRTKGKMIFFHLQI